MKSSISSSHHSVKIIDRILFSKDQRLNHNCEESRSIERYRLAILAMLANCLSSVLGMCVLLLTVPMTLPYLGAERFGVWMTVSSFAAFLSFLDFGIGNGIINRVAEANVKSEKEELAFVATHGLLILTVIGALIALITYPLIIYLPWEKIIKLEEAQNAAEINLTIIVFHILFSISIPLGGILKIYQGLQMAWQPHLIRGLASIASLAAVYVLAEQQAGIPALLIATYGIQTIFPVFLLLSLTKKKILRIGALNSMDWMAQSSMLFKSGGLFLILQVGGLLVWSVDSVIIAATLGAASVTQFVLVQRIFQFVLVPIGIATSPLWGAYADAHARGDELFVARTLRKTIIFTIVISLVSVVILSLLFPKIFEIWIDRAEYVPAALIWSYAGLVFLMATGSTFSVFMNGTGRLRMQVALISLFCIIVIPLKYFGVANSGVEGLICATIMGYMLIVVVPYVKIYKDTVRGASGLEFKKI